MGTTDLGVTGVMEENLIKENVGSFKRCLVQREFLAIIELECERECL